MITLLYTLIGLTVLFLIFLGVREWSGFKVCALCAAVSTTWLILLAWWGLGGGVDPLLIGILMGGSAVGVLYLHPAGEAALERGGAASRRDRKLYLIAIATHLAATLASQLGKTRSELAARVVEVEPRHAVGHAHHLAGAEALLDEPVRRWKAAGKIRLFEFWEVLGPILDDHGDRVTVRSTPPAGSPDRAQGTAADVLRIVQVT